MKALRVGLLVMSLLALAIKLFTFVAHLRDDPTVSLVLHMSPSLENRRILDDSSQFDGAVVLAEDENSLWAESLYSALVSVGWWLLPLLLVAAWLVPSLRRARQGNA